MSTYTIPQLLQQLGLRGYSPRGAVALNAAMNAPNEAAYQLAIKDATIAVLGYSPGDVTEPERGVQSPNSFFGLPVWMPLLIGPAGDIKEQLFLDTAVVSIKGGHRLTITNITEREGEVIEYITQNAITLNITGILAKKTFGYPREQFKALLRYMKLGKPIPVTHELLNMSGVYEIVIESWDAPATEYMNCQRYAIQARQHTPYEIQRK
jgi:hypothetical protein